MPRQVHEFDPPDRFVAGTVGAPGERTFYLQATGAGRLVSAALEKVQVSALAERVDQILDEVRRREGADSDVPVAVPAEAEDLAPLDTPLLEDFRVGTIGLAWEPETRQIVIEAQAVSESGEAADLVEDDATEGPDLLRVRLSPMAARAFAKRASSLVAAGRPTCPLCGLPMDPAGHVCPRQNGHRG